MRRRGLRTGVANIPLTHNSLSVNLARLDQAHQVVASRYADLLPVMTTCGAITRKVPQKAGPGALRSQRRRYRWLRDSLVLQGARKGSGPISGVLADLRYDVDDVVAAAPRRHLRILNCNGDRPFVPDHQVQPLELPRRNGLVAFSDHQVQAIPSVVTSLPRGSWTLVTNLSETDLRYLVQQVPQARSIVGFHFGTGLWLLFGPMVTELPSSWQPKRAIPLGPSALVGSSFSR
jgi:hypothetical protein